MTYQLPQPSGRFVGESNSIGVRGMGIRFPELDLRLPTIELPSLFQSRANPEFVTGPLSAAATEMPPVNAAMLSDGRRAAAGAEEDERPKKECQPSCPPPCYRYSPGCGQGAYSGCGHHSGYGTYGYGNHPGYGHSDYRGPMHGHDGDLDERYASLERQIEMLQRSVSQMVAAQQQRAAPAGAEQRPLPRAPISTPAPTAPRKRTPHEMERSASAAPYIPPTHNVSQARIFPQSGNAPPQRSQLQLRRIDPAIERSVHMQETTHVVPRVFQPAPASQPLPSVAQVSIRLPYYTSNPVMEEKAFIRWIGERFGGRR